MGERNPLVLRHQTLFRIATRELNIALVSLSRSMSARFNPQFHRGFFYPSNPMKTSLDPSASLFGAAYLVVLLVIAVLDSLWLGWLAKDFYRREMGGFAATESAAPPARRPNDREQEANAVRLLASLTIRLF